MRILTPPQETLTARWKVLPPLTHCPPFPPTAPDSFATYRQSTLPIIEHFRQEKKLWEVAAARPKGTNVLSVSVSARMHVRMFKHERMYAYVCRCVR